MNQVNKVILVLGATGQMGGAVADNLLRHGWRVRALTRDPANERAQRLASRGAELFQGDMGDSEALREAMHGAYGVFSVQPPEWDMNAVQEEIRLGTTVTNVAKQANAAHFVYASASCAEKQSHFRPVAKWEIEKHIRAIGLPATILRPTFFMENYTSPFSAIQGGVYSEAIVSDMPVHLIAVDDIGAFVQLSFRHPEQYIGSTLELASDSLTPPEIAAAVSRATGRQIDYVHVPIDALRARNELLARVYEWLNAGGHVVDLPALRRLYPGLTSFEQWLARTDKAKFPV